MLGRSHVAVAAAGWALAAPPVAAALGRPLRPVELVASLAVAAGAGVGPDIDHPDATIAHTHGPLSHAVAELVHETCGGHRGATHWLATGAGLGLVLAAVGALWPRWTLAVALGLCGAWAARCSLPRDVAWHDRVFWSPVGAAAAGWLAYTAMTGAWWVPAAVAWGWCVHPLCDAAASERRPGCGVPMFGLPLPTDGDGRLAELGRWSRRRVAWGLVTFGGPGEHAIAFVCSAVAVVATCWHVTT